MPLMSIAPQKVSVYLTGESNPAASRQSPRHSPYGKERRNRTSMRKPYVVQLAACAATYRLALVDQKPSYSSLSNMAANPSVFVYRQNAFLLKSPEYCPENHKCQQPFATLFQDARGDMLRGLSLCCNSRPEPFAAAGRVARSTSCTTPRPGSSCPCDRRGSAFRWSPCNRSRAVKPCRPLV